MATIPGRQSNPATPDGDDRTLRVGEDLEFLFGERHSVEQELPVDLDQGVETGDATQRSAGCLGADNQPPDDLGAGEVAGEADVDADSGQIVDAVEESVEAVVEFESPGPIDLEGGGEDRADLGGLTQRAEEIEVESIAELGEHLVIDAPKVGGCHSERRVARRADTELHPPRRRGCTFDRG